jgi:glycosyltransferase involved in cell wall biosynthesis
MKRYTILHTIETAGPGGAETVLLNLASQLSPERFRSIAAVPRNDWLYRQLCAAGVPTRIIEWEKWYDLRLPRAMASLVREEDVDLIHSHLPDQNFYSCLVGRWTRRPVVATYHGAIELQHAHRLRQAVKLWTVRNLSDAVVTVSDYLRNLLVAAGFPAKKVVRIYNGIAPEKFSATGNGHLRRELNCHNGEILVGTVANVRQSKGHEYLIRAAHRLSREYPQVRFLAVGDVDSKLGAPLFRLVEELGLQDRFYFLGFRPDVPQILNELDMFVLPSTSEGFPLVALEAMAAAKPMVVTRSGGPQEVVEDGRTGFLVSPGSAEELADGIRRLLADPDRGRRMGQEAKAKLQREFTLARMIREYEALYTRILEQK